VIRTQEHVDEVAQEGAVCPLCRNSNTRVFKAGLTQGLDPTTFGSSRRTSSVGRIIRCLDCGFGFSETRPTEDQLSDIYRQMDVAVYESEAIGRIRTARRHLKILQRYAPSPGRILDVGCASGKFLLECVAAGWEVVGLEPSSLLSEQARELLPRSAEVLPLTLQETDFAESSFDAVTLWDVLEHVPDPLQFFERAFSLLRPGGVLLVNVPNLDSRQARWMGRRWPMYLPEHLNYFNRNSLALCGSLSGARLLGSGQRPTSFSIKYILGRVSQHLPHLGLVVRITSGLSIANWVVPVWMGELYAVWNKPKQAGPSGRMRDKP
jgi:2-polyprenyl-3-methyl-5-hydroxy-6-metoxy-1,4-benzoquinol methylase